MSGWQRDQNLENTLIIAENIIGKDEAEVNVTVLDKQKLYLVYFESVFTLCNY